MIRQGLPGIGAILTVGLLIAGCAETTPAPATPPAATANELDEMLAPPLSPLPTPPTPPVVTQNQATPVVPVVPVVPVTPVISTPPPTPTTNAEPLNPQAVDKLIEDGITMREEIRRLKIERENLIRLLRAIGENYEPPDDDQPQVQKKSPQ